jgi:hypothetical protein
MGHALERLLRAGRDWLLGEKRAGHGLAVMRIGYGAITLITLVLYLPDYSYTFGRGAAWTYPLRTTSAANDYPWPITAVFSRSDGDGVLLVKYVLLMAVALLFTLGWRTRVVAPAFAVLWLSFSALNPVVTNTGHYQTFRVMLLFIVFADLSQHWSLDALRRRRRGEPASRAPGPRRWTPPAWLGRLLHNAAVVLVGYQICVIYVTSALWKLQGRMWEQGIAIYYPLRLEELALFPGLNDLVWKLTPIVYVGTWLGVYLQLLFPVMLLHRWTRLAGLIGVTVMHVGIALLLSLPFFSATMLCADAVFIRERSWRLVADRTAATLRHVRARTGQLLRQRSAEAPAR